MFISLTDVIRSLIFGGFVDGVNRHTRNLASATWVFFSHTGQLVYSGGLCLGHAMNNIAKYCIVIELLLNSISNGVQHIMVHLYLQLVVSQLNGNYRVRDPILWKKYLRVKLLEINFQTIT